MSGSTKVLKWGTVGTLLLGTKAIPIIVAVAFAFVTLISILAATVPEVQGWFNDGYSQTETYVKNLPASPGLPSRRPTD